MSKKTLLIILITAIIVAVLLYILYTNKMLSPTSSSQITSSVTTTVTTPLSSTSIVECTNSMYIKTELGYQPCTPGYKYRIANGVAIEYDYFDIIQEASLFNNAFFEAGQYLSQNTFLTTGTICTDYVTVGSLSGAGVDQYVNTTGINNTGGGLGYRFSAVFCNPKYMYNLVASQLSGTLTIFNPYTTETNDPLLNLPIIPVSQANTQGLLNVISPFVVTKPTLIGLNLAAKYTYRFQFYIGNLFGPGSPGNAFVVSDPYAVMYCIPYDNGLYCMRDNFIGIPQTQYIQPITITYPNNTPILDLPQQPNYCFVTAESKWKASLTNTSPTCTPITSITSINGRIKFFGFVPMVPSGYTGGGYSSALYNGYAAYYLD